MNIFVLDESPVLSAEWQHDRHVVKMILESAQMLSTCAHAGKLTVSTPSILYKSTHVNHPCNIWLRDSMANVAWLTVHLDSLVAEYHRRFRKHHATDMLRIAFNNALRDYLGVDRFWTRDSERHLIIDPAILDLATTHTPFAVCMPDEFKRAEPIYSYRTLYRESKIFQDHVKYTRCDSMPAFLFASNNPRVHDRLAVLTAQQERCKAQDWMSDSDWDRVLRNRAGEYGPAPRGPRSAPVIRVATPSRVPVRFGVLGASK